MNITTKGKFKVGNTVATAKAGKKHKRTIVKQKLGLDNLYDLEEDLIKGWYKMLISKSKTDRRFALKEISRYVFPVRKEITGFMVFDEIEAKKTIEDIFLK